MSKTHKHTKFRSYISRLFEISGKTNESYGKQMTKSKSKGTVESYAGILNESKRKK